MRTVRYFLTNGIFAVCIYFGMFLGNDGALNIALFMGWAASITSFCLYNDKAFESVREKLADETVPLWFDILFDMCIVAAFLYNGYFWLSGFYAFHIITLKDAKERASKALDFDSEETRPA